MSRCVVNTALGRIAGEELAGVRRFLGIPYAQPLVGLARVREARPVEPWAGVLSATAYGASCAQEVIPMMGAGTMGDDCLNLNIWSPPGAQDLPVMVWVHGGGFVTGSGAQSLYEASRLAQENQVVVVSINYRLGILGFGFWEAFPELAAASNLGLRDQILALRWVQEHIAGFGGDPAQVTVFGESAGGMSIACLLASPKARGLFQRAIIQSGSGDHVLRPAEAGRMTEVFAQAAGNVADCLSGPLEGIVQAQRACMRELVERGLHELPVPQFGMTLLPVLGDDILPRHPIVAAAQGAGADIPLIMGTTTEEWNLFYYAPQMMGLKRRQAAPDPARTRHEFERALPGRGERMLARYQALLPEADGDAVFCAFETDRMFRLPTLRLLEARAVAGAASWNYLFDWPCPLMQALKSCHVMEVPFVFGITGAPTGQFFTGGGEAAALLSQQVRAWWASFARDGQPAAQGELVWAPYSLERREALYIAAQPRLVCDAQAARREAWSGEL